VTRSLHLAYHQLSLTHLQPEPRQPYEDAYRLAATVPADLIGPLADALERASQLRLRDPAYDPAWYAANPRGIHPDHVALTRSGVPSTPAVMAAADACWAWLARPVQLDLFAVPA
jgi:hypothetical protein